MKSRNRERWSEKVHCTLALSYIVTWYAHVILDPRVRVLSLDSLSTSTMLLRCSKELQIVSTQQTRLNGHTY